MSYELTSDRLQSLAINCVTQFITKQASLSQAIAKEAQELELNSDQTKRVIEASNTLAYLRQLEKAADRTFEFEVADYEKVMAHMCMPDDLMKTAGGTPPWLEKNKDDTKEGKADDKADDKTEAKSKEKTEDSKDKKEESKTSKEEKTETKAEEKAESKEEQAEEDRSGEEDEAKEQEKKAMLRKGYFQAKSRLEKIAYDKIDLHLQLSTAASKIHKDPFGYEKLAEVVGKEDLTKALKLCGIEKTAGEDIVFRESELVSAKHVVGLWKQAEALVKEEQKLQDFVKRSEAVLFPETANVVKLAGLTNIVSKAVGGVAHGVGTVLNSGAKFLGRQAYSVGKQIGSPSKFMQVAKQTGVTEKDQAIKMFDNLRKNQGKAAALARFKGNSPALLKDRVGPLNVGFGVLTGAGLAHKNNAKDLNK